MVSRACLVTGSDAYPGAAAAEDELDDITRLVPRSPLRAARTACSTSPPTPPPPTAAAPPSPPAPRPRSPPRPAGERLPRQRVGAARVTCRFAHSHGSNRCTGGAARRSRKPSCGGRFSAIRRPGPGERSFPGGMALCVAAPARDSGHPHQ
ncbi:hypothetical protein GCM10027168_57580 [Streptomyces capparidis]